MKKIISVMLLVLIAVGVMTSCGNSSDGAADNSSIISGNSTTVLSTEDVVYYNTDGESLYRVVRPDDSSVTPMASQVFKSLKDALSTNVKNVLDSEDGTDMYEILVGNVDRPEVGQAKAYLAAQGAGRYDDWIICTIGKKIVIYSDSMTSLQTACDYFCKNYIKAEGVEGGICYIYDNKGNYSEITVNGHNISQFSIVRPHYNLSYLAQLEIDAMVGQIYQTTGYMLTVEEDAYVEESDFEIVVGNTNRSGVEKFDDYDHFSVTVSGNKIYLNGGNTYSTAMAVSEFAKMIADGTVTDADSVKNASYKATYSAGYDPAKTYRPVWVDDFDGNEVDTTKWDVIHEEYSGTDSQTGLSGKNGYTCWRVPENIVISDGYYHSFNTKDDENKVYYGGTIRTNNHMSYKYGYVETSCLLPQGSGFWNTLWMNPAQSNGVIAPEIDVNESFGNSAVADANAHVWPTNTGTQEYGYEHRSFDNIRANESKFRVPEGDDGTLKDAFHTYGVVWTEDYIGFTGDGRVYCDLDLNEAGYEDFKLAYTTVRVKMILAATPGAGNCPLPQTATEEEWDKYNVYKSDYVHLYQLEDGGKSELVAESVFEW